MKETRHDYRELSDFVKKVFVHFGLSQVSADISTRVLLEADLRGIPSHGIARLLRYIDGFKTRQILTDAVPEMLNETDNSIVMDCCGGMGTAVSHDVMNRVISKAKHTGAAFGSVRNSNHFGIAGFYAMMALPENMIGIAMTNTAALGVPTFARQVMFGTNPIAFAAPADREEAFVLDMSTTVVTRGKIEVYNRKEEPLPDGWAVDKNGLSAHDPKSLLADMWSRIGGGILPLGGLGELHGGHKGYGLAVMVDILCALLAGAPTGPDIYDTDISSARVSHFFGAIDIARFRDPVLFRKDMDNMLGRLRATPKADEEERVWFAGLKEAEQTKHNMAKGIPLLDKTEEMLKRVGAETGIRFDA